MRRTRAVLIGAVALLVGVRAATAADLGGYGVVLLVVLVLGVLVTALRTWTTDSFFARAASALLAALVLIGQLLACEVGLPGRPAAHWHATSLGVVVLTAAILLLVLGRDDAPASSEVGSHPYAL
jgi:hypothetical protein